MLVDNLVISLSIYRLRDVEENQIDFQKRRSCFKKFHKPSFIGLFKKS